MAVSMKRGSLVLLLRFFSTKLSDPLDRNDTFAAEMAVDLNRFLFHHHLLQILFANTDQSPLHSLPGTAAAIFSLHRLQNLRRKSFQHHPADILHRRTTCQKLRDRRKLSNILFQPVDIFFRCARQKLKPKNHRLPLPSNPG